MITLYRIYKENENVKILFPNIIKHLRIIIFKPISSVRLPVKGCLAV